MIFNYDFDLKKLDSAGLIFTFTSNNNNTNVFRVSVFLKDNVDENVLYNALDIALNQVKYFNLKIRKGLFWYYLENNNKKPLIFKENFYPCSFINKFENNDFLFRISYFKNKINLEVFHVLTDGNGAVYFLKKLLKNYFFILYSNLNRDLFSEDKNNEYTEDSFNYFNSNNIKKSLNFCKINNNINPIKKFKKAYIIKGKNYIYPEIRIISGIISTKELSSLAKSKNATITSYITSVLIWSIYNTNYLKNKRNKKPIEVVIPVNLRKIFSNDTNRNFFSCIQIGIDFDNNDNYNFYDILNIVSKRLKSKLNQEYFFTDIEQLLNLKKNLFIRFIPLFVKSFLVNKYFKFNEKRSTTTVSNIGVIDFEDEFSDYIDRFEFFINPSNVQRIKNTICSYKDNLVISFTSGIRETDIERFFFRFLSDQNLEIKISTNMGIYN